MDKDYQKANISIKKAIEKVLLNSGLKEFFIQNRVKTDDSIQKKINRKDEFGQDKKITDYSGVRIILIRLFEMRKCIEIISKNFEVDYLNSNFNPHSFIEESQFGYRSSHIVVVENDIETEIQIRTLSQHLWATISHSLDYKSTIKDTIFQRKLFRLSSLLEQVDISIEDLYETAPDVNKSNIISLGNLDHYSLEYYLSRKEKIFALIIYSFATTKKSRLKKKKQPKELNFNSKYDISLRVLDGRDSNDKGSIEVVLAVCKQLNLSNIKEFKCFLEDKIKYAKAIRRAFNLSELSEVPFISNSSKVYLFLLVFLPKSHVKRILKENKFGERYVKSIIGFTEKFGKTGN